MFKAKDIIYIFYHFSLKMIKNKEYFDNKNNCQNNCSSNCKSDDGWDISEDISKNVKIVVGVCIPIKMMKYLGLV